MQTRKRNAPVASMAKKDTMKMRNADGAEGAIKRSYADAASPGRSTRSRAASQAASPVRRGNNDVADEVQTLSSSSSSSSSKRKA